MTKREMRERRELCAAIEALTGRPPASSDILHLRRRLEMLRTQRRTMKEWHDEWERAGVTRSITIEVGVGRHALLRKIASGAVSVGDVVRRAIDELAVKQGYGVEVERLKRPERK